MADVYSAESSIRTNQIARESIGLPATAFAVLAKTTHGETDCSNLF